MKKATVPMSVVESHTPPPNYDRQPSYDTMKQERVKIAEIKSQLVEACSINNLLRKI